MRTRTLLAAVALAAMLGFGAAHGALRAVEQAYELTLADLTLPGNDSGYLMVRLCPRCRPQVLRVNAETRYLVRPSPAPVPLATMREQARSAAGRGADRAFCYVYYDPKTRYVRRVVLDAAR